MSIPAQLLAHVRGEVVTLAWCWKVTRLDGQIFGFTTHVEPILFAGTVYDAASGFMASAIDYVDTLAVDNLEIQGVLESDSITSTDLQAGRWDAATLEIFFINYRDLTMGRALRFVGTIGAVSTGRIAFSAEQRGITQPLSQNVGRIVTNECDAVFGDARCTKPLGPLTYAGTVGASPTKQTFVDAGRTEADGVFNGGNFTVLTGASAGLKMEVKTSLATGQITLVLPLFYGLAAGDTYTISQGCNHLLKLDDGTYGGDCKVRHSNVRFYRGKPEVPGTDRITQVGGRTNA